MNNKRVRILLCFSFLRAYFSPTVNALGKDRFNTQNHVISCVSWQSSCDHFPSTQLLAIIIFLLYLKYRQIPQKVTQTIIQTGNDRPNTSKGTTKQLSKGIMIGQIPRKVPQNNDPNGKWLNKYFERYHKTIIQRDNDWTNTSKGNSKQLSQWRSVLETEMVNSGQCWLELAWEGKIGYLDYAWLVRKNAMRKIEFTGLIVLNGWATWWGLLISVWKDYCSVFDR